MSKKDNFIACLVLHALGDTIGYKNGDWEFNYLLDDVESDFSDDLLFEFISLGGINGINLDKWIVSDDTIMHMETGYALLEETKNVNKYGDILTKKYLKCMNNMFRRSVGATVKKNMELIKNGVKWNKLPYDYMAGGSGGSMRTSCIGLIFSGEKNRQKLIEFSIEASRITHNSVIGYLGGLVSALFTAYAIEGININEWPFQLINLLESNKVDNFIKKTRDFDKYIRDKEEFINYWKKFIEIRYKGNTIDESKFFRIPSARTNFYVDHFSKNKALPGFMGHDSVIFAFDALISAGKNWETLVVYSMLHAGDSDSTGCIAASWYGALYGFHQVPENNLKYLEYKKELYKLGQNLYKISNSK